jgi:hypothetical protein
MADYRAGRKLVSVTFTEADYARFKTLCDQMDQPMSTTARKIINDEVERLVSNAQG